MTFSYNLLPNCCKVVFRFALGLNVRMQKSESVAPDTLQNSSCQPHSKLSWLDLCEITSGTFTASKWACWWRWAFGNRSRRRSNCKQKTFDWLNIVFSRLHALQPNAPRLNVPHIFPFPVWMHLTPTPSCCDLQIWKENFSPTQNS